MTHTRPATGQVPTQPGPSAAEFTRDTGGEAPERDAGSGAAGTLSASGTGESAPGGDAGGSVAGGGAAQSVAGGGAAGLIAWASAPGAGAGSGAPEADSGSGVPTPGGGGGGAESGAGGGAPEVIAGAGPVIRPGERATVRLREGAEEEPARYAPEWLRLREGADAAARAEESLDLLRTRLSGRAGGIVVHDLGCGTGSMGRWLAPRLDGAQHWVLHDRDPYLLHFAAAGSPKAAADGSRVTVETRRADVSRLTADALAGASLVTASALLDVLTREEVETLADACTGAGCPALLTLSVAGRVELGPADPLDAEIMDAFNAHQRRGGLLGPDAVNAAREAFTGRGATVRVLPSAWRLGPGEAALTAQWLRGWVGAAVEQRPDLDERAERYLQDRLAACASGDLHVVVHHDDLLALPGPEGGPA